MSSLSDQRTITVSDEAAGLTLGDLRELVAAAEGMPNGMPVIVTEMRHDTIYWDALAGSLTVTTTPSVRPCSHDGCHERAVMAEGHKVYCAEHTPLDAEAV